MLLLTLELGAAGLAGEIFQGLTLVKILVAVAVVLILSQLAERVSPKFAGVLSGFPLGAAITLFFVGYEINLEFAADSAIYTVIGLVATQGFVFGYYQALKRAPSLGRLSSILLATTGGMIGYLVLALLFNRASLGLLPAVAVTLVSIIFFNRLFRRIEDRTIEKRVRISLRLMMIRALTAAAIIVMITASAKTLGPKWAGLLAAFPITMFPFLVIIHYTYQPGHVLAIIKNVPRGLVAIVVYAVVVRYAYPALGLAWGTIAAYAGATTYLVLLNYWLPFL